MKRLLATVLALAVMIGLTACAGSGGGSGNGEVSVFYYNYSDTYISSVRAAMDKLLKEANLEYQNYDANGNQTTQTEQVTTAIAKGSKLLVVNVVDTGSNDAAQNIVDQAKAKNIPVIFFNRSVDEKVVSSYDKCVFVGTDYEMAGHMQGQMIGEYLVNHYDAVDLNGDDTKIINQYDNKTFIELLRTMHSWYKQGLIPSDAATSNKDYPLEGNTWLMRGETQGPYDYGDTILTNAAKQELVSKAITVPLKSTGQAQMANFVVSNTSKNKEKSVEFLGLLNSDPELLNGLVWGI